MIYKFKSKAAGDVIMLAPTGDHLMRLIGREPAPKGIFEPAAMPGTIASQGAKEIMVWLSASIRPQDGVGGWAPSPT